MDITVEFTQKEYLNAQKSVEGRQVLINGKAYYPLKKDLLVEVTERLIIETIYGAQVGQRFKDELVGLKELIEELSDYAEDKGHILSVDGREIECSAGRYGLNYCLQSSGSIIVKQWMVNTQDILNTTTLEYGVDYWQAGYYHDEFQYIAKKEYAQLIADTLEKASEPLQEQFNLNLPFVAEAMIGNNWSETH